MSVDSADVLSLEHLQCFINLLAFPNTDYQDALCSSRFEPFVSVHFGGWIGNVIALSNVMMA